MRCVPSHEHAMTPMIEVRIIKGMKQKIGLVDDDDKVRRRFAQVIDNCAGFELWFETGTVQGAIEWMDKCPIEAWPPVWLVDLGLPDGSGLKVIRHALALHPRTQVMVVSVFGDDAKVLDCIDAGALGYILKGQGDEDITVHLADLLHGGSPMSPFIARQVLSRVRRGREPSLPSQRTPILATVAAPASHNNTALVLTLREQEVLALIARGYSYDEVALRLQLTLNTVRQHIRGIYTKLGVHSKVDAINEARRRQWLGAE